MVARARGNSRSDVLTMLELHPNLDMEQPCPRCGELLAARGWYTPGMRTFAKLHCVRCDRAFVGDLSVGGSINYEMLLDAATGDVFGGEGAPWLKNWLLRGFKARTADPPPMQIERFRPLRRALLLNCLDVLYGHSLLKLLNAQHHLDEHADFDLLLLIPRCLRWLVPEGVAEIWTIDIPLTDGWFWNDGLDRELHERVADCKSLHVSRALSHPAPEDVDIERFSRVRPFDVDGWPRQPVRPVVTYIWRDDRRWGLPLHPHDQATRGMEFAKRLRTDWPNLDFAVAGIGRDTPLPEGLVDLRLSRPSDDDERELCRRYAASHIVVGIHGSNMLLPSAHAAATIDLMPEDRWGNVTQDIIFRNSEPREAAFRYRFVPASISAEELAVMASSLLRAHTEHARICWGAGCRHASYERHAKALISR